MENLTEIAEGFRSLELSTERAREEFLNHPRIREWIGCVLKPREFYFINSFSFENGKVGVNYWCPSGDDALFIPLEVLNSNEPIEDYYDGLEKEQEKSLGLIKKRENYKIMLSNLSKEEYSYGELVLQLKNSILNLEKLKLYIFNLETCLLEKGECPPFLTESEVKEFDRLNNKSILKNGGLEEKNEDSFIF